LIVVLVGGGAVAVIATVALYFVFRTFGEIGRASCRERV